MKIVERVYCPFGPFGRVAIEEKLLKWFETNFFENHGTKQSVHRQTLMRTDLRLFWLWIVWICFRSSFLKISMTWHYYIFTYLKFKIHLTKNCFFTTSRSCFYFRVYMCVGVGIYIDGVVFYSAKATVVGKLDRTVWYKSSTCFVETVCRNMRSFDRRAFDVHVKNV